MAQDNKAVRRKSYAKNAEKRRKAAKEYRKKNPEKRKAIEKKSAAKRVVDRREYMREYMRKYRAAKALDGML